MKYHLVLGSNLGNREKNLQHALKRINKSGLVITKKSSLYESEPVGMKNQPWFLNQAVEVRSESDPQDLLSFLKNIEKDMGRRSKGGQDPREIDIDIILAGEMILDTDDLVIPHPRLHLRNFVLIPLNEIAPDACHPVYDRSIGELLKKTRDRSCVKIWSPHARKD